MTVNVNMESGVAFGYISAQALDPDIVNELMNGTDVYYEEAWQNFVASKLAEATDEVGELLVEYFDPEDFRDEFNDSYQPDEPIHEGEITLFDGGKVKYRTSWLGGALNVFIFESPFITDAARRASPCVPNAGILDTLDGDVKAYDVPPDWRWTPPVWESPEK